VTTTVDMGRSGRYGRRVTADDWQAVSAVATGAAALVALFGPPIHDSLRLRRARPRVSVLANRQRPVVHVSIQVSNEEGRDSATDVEVFCQVQATTPGDALLRVGPWRALLDGQATTHVPPGFSRTLQLVVFDDQLAESASGKVGQPIGRFDGDRLYASSGTKYVVSVAVTGSNFDAVFYECRFEIDEKPLRWIVPVWHWTAEPQRVSQLPWGARNS
jgi:hypothetical protein